MNKIVRHKFLFLGLLILLLVVYFVYKKVSPNTPAITYTTTAVQKGNLVVSISTSGTISSSNTASVTTTATGVVKNVYVKNGDTVRSGQKIADLDLDQTSLQKYQSALASYPNAKNSVDSAVSSLYSLQSKLFAANQKLINDAAARGLTTSDPTYIQQNADWLAAEATYKQQQNVITSARAALVSSSLSLQQSGPTIVAPISGKVEGLTLEKGSIVNSAKVGNITTNASPLVSVNLTEVDVTKVALGQKTIVTLDAFSDKTFTGVVSSIDTAGSVNSNVTVYPTTIKLDTTPDNLYPNMSAQATIITAVKNDVLLVPNSAITTQNGISTVKVKSNDAITNKTVQVGLFSDTQSEIISGLSEGEEVVTATNTTSTSLNPTQSTSLFSGTNRGFGGAAGGAVRIGR